jgi:4-amino-4-deoxy-L-arabinose transferase-like glycosyltransferase
VCWVALAIWAAVIVFDTVTHDFRDPPPVGDQTSHVAQALSLAYDSHTLNFDQQDLTRWQSIGWLDQPYAVLFQRYDGDRWAFAKPYGYSLYLAPFIAAFGVPSGVAIGNTLLLLLVLGLVITAARIAYRGPAVPLIAAATVLAAYTYMYAYVVLTELFLASLVLAALTSAAAFHRSRRPAWALLSMALMGFGVSEKPAFLALFAPVVAVLVWQERRRWLRVAMPVLAATVFAVSCLPYLKYSDWQSFTPYGGERYQVRSSTPFNGGGFVPATFETESSLDQLFDPVSDKLEAAAYYVVGEHTGMLVFIPFALLVIVASLLRWRDAGALGRALLIGVLAYILSYVVLFPLNFYGGGQSLGNRYFLQIAPAVVILAVWCRLSPRLVSGLAIAGIVVGLVMLWPQHSKPNEAYSSLDKTSALQRLMPFEANQIYRSSFGTPPP